jgi:hypothetical protein
LTRYWRNAIRRNCWWRTDAPSRLRFYKQIVRGRCREKSRLSSRGTAGIESHERWKKPPVGFRNTTADEIALLRQSCFEPIQCVKQGTTEAFYAAWVGGETGSIDSIVERLVNTVVDRIYLGAQ